MMAVLIYNDRFRIRTITYTCNPHKFEIPTLRFPRKVPVIPCKHLQCRNCGLKVKVKSILDKIFLKFLHWTPIFF